MAKVSIVAPVYGVEKYIDQFLKSIKEQTFDDLEVIFVDDGSPDNCPKILDEFVKTDDRYQVIHQKNAGVSEARNNGLKKITGEYVYIVDSDDWLTPEAVEKLYECAKRTNADVVYGDWYEEFDDGRTELIDCFLNPFSTCDPDTIKKLQCGVLTNNCSVNLRCKDFPFIGHLGGAPWRFLIRSSIIRENKLEFDPYVRGLGDDILFSLTLYQYVERVSYIKTPIYHYRDVAESYSHGYKANYVESIGLIFDRMEEFLKNISADQQLFSFYYYRVLLYLNQGVKRYFKNSNNPTSEKDRYKEFIRTVNGDPYKVAIKKAPLSLIQNKKSALSYMLLRIGLFKLYWVLKK